MDDFISYLLKEYQLPNDVVCNKVVCTHSTKNKIDKKSNIPITNNVITIKIESYDKEHQLLSSITEKFIDGQINRTKAKPLVNISPSELNNRFGVAKSFICSQIQKSYSDKLKDLNDSINELKQYCGSVNSVIPNEYINEPIITKEPIKNKFEF